MPVLTRLLHIHGNCILANHADRHAFGECWMRQAIWAGKHPSGLARFINPADNGSRICC